MRERIVYWGARGLLGLSRIFPRPLLYLVAGLVVERGFGPGSRRHGRILEHLAIAFPEAPLEEREAIAAKYRWHKARFFVETVLMLTGRFDYEKAVVNPEEAKKKIEALKARNGKGMIFLVSHYGNWEFLAQFFALNGLPGTLVAKEHGKNRLIDEKIIRPYRSGFGHRVIERKGALRSVAKILKKKEGVGIHIDQMIPPPNGVSVEFFGRPAYASKSMAGLKLGFDPLMVPIFAVREGREKFRVIIMDPVEYEAEEVEDAGEKIRRMTGFYTGILEKQIRRIPEQWEWNYKRWRMPAETANR